MKAELVSQPHPQSKAIQHRYGDVMQRWKKLGEDSEAHKARLRRALEQCHKVYICTPQITCVCVSCDYHLTIM